MVASSEDAPLGEAHVASMAEDHVIVDPEPEESRLLRELTRQVDVVLERREVS